LGAFIALNAPQIRFVTVSGVVTQVARQGSASDDTDTLRLVGDDRQFVIHPQGFHPVMATTPQSGATITLWIEADNLNTYAIQAPDVRGQSRFYQSNLYEHRALIHPLVFGVGVLMVAAGVVCAAVAPFFPAVPAAYAAPRQPVSTARVAKTTQVPKVQTALCSQLPTRPPASQLYTRSQSV
jgi:hypothetical protein